MPLPAAIRTSRAHATVRVTVLFVVFVCLALLAVDFWLALRAREKKMRQATVASNNLTQAISHQLDGVFSETTRMLATIEFELESTDSSAKTLERLQPVLVNYVATTEHLHGVFVFDAQGRWLVNSEARPFPDANNADRAYFIHHRDSLSTLRFIGKPVISRSTGVWIIPVSQRINDRDGHFAGVVLATIGVDYIGQLMAHYEIGEQGALTLLEDDGTVLARRPFAADSVGKNISGTGQFALLRSQVAGNAMMVSPIDGIERLVSFRHLKDHPLLLVVALSRQEILQSWRAATYFETGWILVLCLFIVGSGGYVVQSVRQRLNVELRLRQTRDELTEANVQLARLARHDALTGLANRRYLDEYLEREFAQALRTKRPLSLVMIDVDHFKSYNDSYGHPGGDKCLQQIARAVESAARRPQDFVARYGGEELVVLLPDTDSAGALVVAETIHAAVAALRLPFSRYLAGHVSISAGVATLGAADRSMAGAVDLLSAADRALYRAKEAGRNRVVAMS